nr:Ankyrin repeat domain containing protein [Pandoravirus aubagnensis]
MTAARADVPKLPGFPDAPPRTPESWHARTVRLASSWAPCSARPLWSQKKNGCAWDVRALKAAIYHDHVECLRYMHEYGMRWDRHACRRAPLIRGQCFDYRTPLSTQDEHGVGHNLSFRDGDNNSDDGQSSSSTMTNTVQTPLSHATVLVSENSCVKMRQWTHRRHAEPHYKINANARRNVGMCICRHAWVVSPLIATSAHSPIFVHLFVLHCRCVVCRCIVFFLFGMQRGKSRRSPKIMVQKIFSGRHQRLLVAQWGHAKRDGPRHIAPESRSRWQRMQAIFYSQREHWQQEKKTRAGRPRETRKKKGGKKTLDVRRTLKLGK